MKSLKKTLVLLVVLSMLVSAISPVFAVKFNDEIPEAYWEHANKLAAVGVIAGDQNGNFNATSNITRAEMAVIICKMAGLNEAAATASKNIPSIFTDVPAGEWYTGWINLAVDNGMIAGFPDQTFRPNDPLTTNQAITLVVKSLGKGVYVDKMGTWPGNYVQEAAKLGLTNKMVDTGSDLANRGNVAILAWEALQVGTWDVVETNLESGEVTLSESDSLLEKYFKDFVAGKGTARDPYKTKLVEDATVVKSGRTTSELGPNQITLEVGADTKFNGKRPNVEIGRTISEYIEAQNKPRKNAKEATYVGERNAQDQLIDDVIAYVPEDVASIASLVGKKVDVLFGADNVVALLYVTEDAVDDVLVTEWDADTNKITVGDTTYKVKDATAVSVFNHEIGNGAATITTVIVNALGVEDPKTTFNRALKADITVDANGKLDTINFTFSEAVAADVLPNITVEQGIVKTITKAGVIKRLDGASFFGGDKVEDLDDDDDIRIIKDGEVVTFADIAEGDVITAVKVGDNYEIVYISTEKAEGKVTAVEDYVFKTDSDELFTTKLPVVNLEGEFEDAEEVDDRNDLIDLLNEEVEFYLTFTGEIAGAITSAEATGKTLGVVAKDTGDTKYDDDDREYLEVRILTEDGETKRYSIYNSKKSEDEMAVNNGKEGDALITYADGLAKGTLVEFEADANNRIKSNKISKIVTAAPNNEYTFTSEKGVTAIAVEPDQLTGNEAKKRLVVGAGDNAVTYNWKDSTVSFARDNAKHKVEVISDGWGSLINAANEIAQINNVVMFVKGTKIIYFAAEYAAYQSSDDMYGLRLDNSQKWAVNDDEEKIYEIKFFTADDAAFTKEIDENHNGVVARYGFARFTYSDNEIDDTITTLITSIKEFADLEDDDAVAPIVVGAEHLVDGAKKAQFKVDEAELDNNGGQIIYSSEEEDPAPADPNHPYYAQLATVDLDEDVVVFDFTDYKNPAVISIDDIEKGDYAICFKGANDEDATVVVVFTK